MSDRLYPRLVGDIGGTNARFALAHTDGRLGEQRTLETREHASLAEAVDIYLAGVRDTPPRSACLGIAGPVDGDQVRLTNGNWAFSIGALRAHLKLDALVVINDFEAVAHAVPFLQDADSVRIGGVAAGKQHPMVVLGAGTGFGVALVVPVAGSHRIIATQGGHASIGACDEAESRILNALRHGDMPVSREDVLSGPGLEALYRCICRQRNIACQSLSALDISTRAVAGSDPECCATLDQFCAFLGTAAADQALSCGAKGGVYIAGGIVPSLIAYLQNSRFRIRFDNHRTMREYLAPIPVQVITHPHPGLLGAARLAIE
jgi:glucokinase